MTGKLREDATKLPVRAAVASMCRGEVLVDQYGNSAWAEFEGNRVNPFVFKPRFCDEIKPLTTFTGWYRASDWVPETGGEEVERGTVVVHEGHRWFYIGYTAPKWIDGHGVQASYTLSKRLSSMTPAKVSVEEVNEEEKQEEGTHASLKRVIANDTRFALIAHIAELQQSRKVLVRRWQMPGEGFVEPVKPLRWHFPGAHTYEVGEVYEYAVFDTVSNELQYSNAVRIVED